MNTMKIIQYILLKEYGVNPEYGLYSRTDEETFIKALSKFPSGNLIVYDYNFIVIYVIMVIYLNK